jgi:hypothetical protein
MDCVRANRATNPEKYRVIPILFIATIPEKYCYRTIATFIKHAMNMPPIAALQRHNPRRRRRRCRCRDLTP